MTTSNLFVKIQSLRFQYPSHSDRQECKRRKTTGSNQVGKMHILCGVANGSLEWWNYGTAQDHHNQKCRTLAGIFAKSGNGQGQRYLAT